MHKVELRLTQEGTDQPNANFEVYVETLKDGNYIESAPMRAVAGGETPITMFLEGNERVIVVAKSDTGRMVYDKDQNANVRVETDEEKKARSDREATVAQSKADQAVRDAQAEVQAAADQSEETKSRAATNLKKAEEAAAKVRSEQDEKRKAATEQLRAGTAQPVPPAPSSGSAPATPRPGAPASANTGPIDSKQVKNG